MENRFIRAEDVAQELNVSKPNVLTRKLNVSANRLYNDYGIRYESKRTHEGRTVCLTLEQPKA